MLVREGTPCLIYISTTPTPIGSARAPTPSPTRGWSRLGLGKGLLKLAVCPFGRLTLAARSAPATLALAALAFQAGPDNPLCPNRPASTNFLFPTDSRSGLTNPDASTTVRCVPAALPTVYSSAPLKAHSERQQTRKPQLQRKAPAKAQLIQPAGVRPQSQPQ